MIGASSVDLRAAVARDPLWLDLRDYAPDAILHAQRHWGVHTAAEFSSARVFAGLIPQLMRAGLDFERVSEVNDMARQELEHGLASARVLVALGGTPHLELPPLSEVPIHDDTSPVVALLRNVLAISCCGETLAVAVLGGERERARLEPLRRVLERILSDEIGHARFGWGLCAELAPSLGPAERADLSAYLVNVFERDLRAMSHVSQQPAVSDSALALGASDGPLAYETFLACMHEVTIPALDGHGLAASWAFAKACSRAGISVAPRPLPLC